MSLIFFTSARLAFIQIIKLKKMLLSDITNDKNKMIQCNNEQYPVPPQSPLTSW